MKQALYIIIALLVLIVFGRHFKPEEQPRTDSAAFAELLSKWAGASSRSIRWPATPC